MSGVIVLCSVGVPRCLITSACFAVLCVFALSILSCSFNAQYSEQNTQRQDAKDRKARQGSNVARLCRRVGEDRICPFTKIDHRR